MTPVESFRSVLGLNRNVARPRGLPLLLGYRGHQPADLDALRELLLRVSQLAGEVPEIAELNLKPVIALALGLGCRVVDARVKLRAL